MAQLPTRVGVERDLAESAPDRFGVKDTTLGITRLANYNPAGRPSEPEPDLPGTDSAGIELPPASCRLVRNHAELCL